MGFWQRLFSTAGKSAGSTAVTGLTTGEAEKRLAEFAFLLKRDNTEPPHGTLTEEQQAFLQRLNQARSAGAAHRRNFIEDMLRQAEAQGVPRALMAAQLKDPVDEVLPGWHSLAILFDWDKMDGNYGPQAFQAYFKRVEPARFSGPAVLHFGDLIQFDSYCAILTRSRTLSELAYLAERFGPEFQWPGLLPHGVRFLRGDSSDGHLITRNFCLPLTGELNKGKVTANPQAGADWILQEAARGTAWKCS